METPNGRGTQMSKEDFRVLVNQAMDRKGIQTKKEIAERAERDASWVSRITTGNFKETPPPEDLEVLHAILGIPPAALLDALGYDIGIDTGTQIQDYRLIDLSEQWPHLTEEEREWILEIADASKRRRELRSRVLAVADGSDSGYSVGQG